ncbi:hypothetical protein C1645_826550 [Glomus cerebriforme]|uniref:DUF659 domain-containing protein n=1 Tax=Glomus cerebriforme TaxID=658196 RepID=A0A397SRE9_9GLOM|nr:hypothetical protein C1645_826550 [Glomus cerebriforme]
MSLFITLINKECGIVMSEIRKKLASEINLTLGFDRWTSPASQSLYIFVVIIADGREYIHSLKNFSKDSHTGEFLNVEILRVLNEVGIKKFSIITQKSIFVLNKSQWNGKYGGQNQTWLVTEFQIEIFLKILEFFEKCYPDTNAKTLKALIWSIKDDSYYSYGGDHRHGSSLKEVIEHIKTIPGKPFSLPAISDDNSGYKELIELDERWIKKRKPEDEPKFKQITITKIEITKYYKELVFKKLQMNVIIDDVYKIEQSQKINGSLPLYDIIINDQLQLKKTELGKTFKESIKNRTGEKIGLDLSIWETAFIMVYLETFFNGYYNKWKHVYEKAKKWIDGKLSLFKQFDQLKVTCMDYLIELGIEFYKKPIFIHTFEINNNEMEPVYRSFKDQTDINCLLKSISENDRIVSVASGKFKITFDDKTIKALKYYIDALGARRFDKEVLVSFFAIIFLDTFLKDDNISKSKRESARNQIHDKVQNTELAESITRVCEQYLRKQVYDFFTENDLMIDL